MLTLPVLNISGKEVEKIHLPEEIFGKTVNTGVLHQAVVAYQTSLRQATVSTKTRGEVSGGGVKPWRQKGTGRARVGSIRSPLWVGGGTTFGPHPRNFEQTLSPKIRKTALRESLKVKFQDKNLICLQDLKDSLSKTKEFAKILANLKLRGKTLGVLDGSDGNVVRVTRNIPFLDLMRARDVNAYAVLRHQNFLVTKTGLQVLLERIRNGSSVPETLTRGPRSKARTKSKTDGGGKA